MSTRTIRLLIAAFVVLLLIAVIVLRRPSSTGPRTPVEVIHLPFNKPDEVLTAGTYSGNVFFNITGQGKLSPDLSSDAFYPFKSSGLVTDDANRDFGFMIDNKYADILTIGNLPPYRPDHIYNDLFYFVAGEARHLSFRVADWNTADNSGELVIEIFNTVPASYQGG
jgi:hypothetical protein